jgi:hypothetical protein
MKADWPSAEGYQGAAWLLMCDVAAIKAVAEVEAGPEGAFLPTDEPVILFEPHLFDRFTNGKHRGAIAPGVETRYAEISYPKWRRGTYGPSSIQHRKLAAAAALDRDAALRASSWGLFQVLGDNFRAAGFSTLQRFVTAMYRSADDHLRGLTMFMRSDERLVDAIRAHAWPALAEAYNGPGYRENHYDEKLAVAFKKHSATG